MKLIIIKKLLAAILAAATIMAAPGFASAVPQKKATETKSCPGSGEDASAEEENDGENEAQEAQANDEAKSGSEKESLLGIKREREESGEDEEFGENKKLKVG